ncbi:MAG: glycosyltransferase family 9 protein [Deltaproteobacteria bacterium]|nr:glycosyltransferase family 9 protein [Deltaproteobacteria bacterium]
MNKIRRILVIKNRAIGDTILTTGPLRILKHRFPGYQIHAMVRSPAGELLEGLPYVDRIISAVEPKEKVERIAYWMRLVRRLREKRYDLVLNFHASFRTALTAKMLRADECIANHHELTGHNWFSDREVPGRGVVKPVIDRDLDVLRAIGIDAKLEDAMPEIVLSPAERAEAAALFARDEGGKGPRVFLGIGGSRATKRWPAHHVASLVHRLAVEHDARFVLSTIASDREWLDELWPLLQKDPAIMGRVRHFSSSSLRQTARIVSQCAFYVGNDSGLKHLAVALGLKTFTFFGPEAPLEWHPYDTIRHPYAFLEKMPCRTESGKHWCAIDVCTAHAHKCMQNITPESVWDDMTGWLRPESGR